MSVFYYYHGIRKTNYNECSVVYRNVPYHSVPYQVYECVRCAMRCANSNCVGGCFDVQDEKEKREKE